MKPLSEYGPRKGRTKIIQAHVDEDIYRAADHLREELGWTWVELVSALIKRAMDEHKSRKKGV